MDKAALGDWLSHFQRLDMRAEHYSGPGEAAATYGRIIGEVAAGMSFDTNPADFNKLLHDLAPEITEDDSK